MERSKKFKKIIISLSFLVLILCTGIYFAYYQIRIKNENILRMEEELSLKNVRHEYLVSLQNLVKNIEPEINKVENSIIPKSSDVLFIESLENLARSYSLQINIDSLNLVKEKTISSEDLSTLKVKSRVSGTWSSVYRYIAELESLNYKIKIDKLILSNKSELTSSGNQNLNINWEAIFEISVLEYK